MARKGEDCLSKAGRVCFGITCCSTLPVQELAASFRDDFGRPSKDLSVALGALILQQLHDLTDQQTTEAVALNIAWHYALDIRHEPDAYLCERTLRNYRRRILELGLDEVLFRTLTDRLIQAVGVDTTKQRLDSTTVKSAIRGLTRLGILVEATSKFLRELKRRQPERYAEVDADIVGKYVARQGDGCFADTRPSESKRRLPEAARDVYELIEQFRQTAAATLESFRLATRNSWRLSTAIARASSRGTELLLDVKSRGLTIDPKLATGDGALGFWKALPKVFPTTREQRCWFHKSGNVIDKLPKPLQPRAKEKLHDIWMAETREDAQRAFNLFLESFGAKYPKACECLAKDRDVLLTFYDFPAEHWIHLRTTNPIESVFATVKHRQKKTRGNGSRAACLAMVFKLTESASRKWRALNGTALLPDVIQGVQFINGIKRDQAAA